MAKNGLSNTEMEDLLSCDDAVLQDTYLYHLPASETLIRLPPLLWRRVNYDLREYLVQRQAGGKDIINWYHRQFAETAESRYAPPKVRKRLHGAIADYFMGKWSDQVKPLELYKKKKGSYPQAMRGVPCQPVRFCPTVYNLRKLDELPFHLIQAKRSMEMLTEVCQNLEWLFTKCKAMNISEVLNDIKQALFQLKSKLGKDAKPVENAEDLNQTAQTPEPEDNDANPDPANGSDVDQDIAKKLNGEVNDAYITELADNEGNLIDEGMEEEDEVSKEENEDMLKVIVKDMKLIYQMLMLASDAVRKDVSNLPIQVILCFCFCFVKIQYSNRRPIIR